MIIVATFPSLTRAHAYTGKSHNKSLESTAGRLAKELGRSSVEKPCRCTTTTGQRLNSMLFVIELSERG